VIIDREQWIKEAEKAEKAGGVATSQAIISEAIGMGVEDEDRKKTWIEDAEGVCARGRRDEKRRGERERERERD
jgi:pre-mRNA-processing factor 6